MSNEKKILFYNNSGFPGSICILQKLTEPPADTYSTAWLAQRCCSDTYVLFSWKTEWDLVWCQTGSLKPGASIRAFQLLPKDPFDTSNNGAVLTKQDGAYRFTSGQPTDSGSLMITTDGTLPNNDVSVGIGMDNSWFSLTQGTLNYHYRFKAETTYTACFGNISQGQVLSDSDMINSYNFSFPINISNLKIELDETNQWHKYDLTDAQLTDILAELKKEGKI